MAGLLRGDVVWANLNPTVGNEQSGRRPVVILSRDEFNARSGMVIAMALTSQEPKAGAPFHLEVTTAKLPKRSWAKVTQVRTLSVRRLGARISRADAREVDRLVEGLNKHLGR
jgi:mRNA interferase MazF